MHRFLIIVSTFAITVGVATQLAHGQTDTPATPAQTEAAPPQPATATAPPAAPAPSCDGMIPEAKLAEACEAKLQQDAEWREKIGRRLGLTIMDAVAAKKPVYGESDSAASPRTSELWIDVR